ncbi:hypothetical protein HKD37_04G010761 [Glycine soja]
MDDEELPSPVNSNIVKRAILARSAGVPDPGKSKNEQRVILGVGQHHTDLALGQVLTGARPMIKLIISQRPAKDVKEALLGGSLAMAPKKLLTTRARKDVAGEGSSAAPQADIEFDEHRFRSEEHQRRFKTIKGPMAKFDPEIVMEFYANAWPTEEGVRDKHSWVRGQWIPYDEDAINQFLGHPLVLEEEQHWITPPRHPVDPEKSNRALGFLALITSICQFYGMPVMPTKLIHPPINRSFIKKYCMPRQAQQSGQDTISRVHLSSHAEDGTLHATLGLPADRPNFQAEAGPIEAPGDEDRAKEDGDMADVMDFFL